MSGQQPSVGRILHVYSSLWRGPRPGIVVNAFPDAPSIANVNVFLDGYNDAGVLAEIRQRPSGNTFPSCPVLEPQTGEGQRAAAADRYRQPDGFFAFAEWPPYVPPVPAAKSNVMGLSPGQEAKLQQGMQILERAKYQTGQSVVVSDTGHVGEVLGARACVEDNDLAYLVRCTYSDGSSWEGWKREHEIGPAAVVSTEPAEPPVPALSSTG